MKNLGQIITFSSINNCPTKSQFHYSMGAIITIFTRSAHKIFNNFLTLAKRIYATRKLNLLSVNKAGTRRHTLC